MCLTSYISHLSSSKYVSMKVIKHYVHTRSIMFSTCRTKGFPYSQVSMIHIPVSVTIMSSRFPSNSEEFASELLEMFPICTTYICMFSMQLFSITHYCVIRHGLNLCIGFFFSSRLKRRCFLDTTYIVMHVVGTKTTLY